MLTKRKIKKFCTYAVGVFLTSAKDDITITKKFKRYNIILSNKRAPEHIIREAWNYHSVNTQFEDVILTIL